MSKTLGIKIISSALVIPALAGLFMYRAQEKAKHPAPKTREPQITEKSMTIRQYRVRSYRDVYIFTDPDNPDRHCLASESEYSVYNCYPNAPGPKPDKGRPLDIVRYKTPTIGDVLTFIDPENPALRCLAQTPGRTYICSPITPPAAPPPQPR